MSSTLRIAAVTSTLRHVLHESLSSAEPGSFGGTEVTNVRPDQHIGRGALGDSAAGLNVFLYRVTSNEAWGPKDLPSRRADGSRTQQTMTALDLHYLVTAWGNDASLEEQRLLAHAVVALAGTPVLTRPVITAAIAQYGVDDMTILATSDLAEQTEEIRVSPALLSLEEASNLWRALSTPYLLSLAYTATFIRL